MSQVVFMGTPDFASGVLEALIQSPYHVEAVFTQPDRPKGRGKSLQMSPVKETALKAGIDVYQPKKIREPENADLLRKMAPDFIVVAAFGQIIPQSILDIPRYGCLNVHASLLPAWRGAAPIQWSILNGDKETGVTIMRMNAGLDTGDIVSRRSVEIRRDETGGSLFDRLMPVGADLLLETMKLIEEGKASYTPQPRESTTPYAAMLTKKSGLIDWTRSADEIERLVRGLSPWPSAYTYANGRMLKIWKSEVEALPEEAGRPQDGNGPEDRNKPQGGVLPGTVLCAEREKLLVQTGSGILSLLEVQPEGKKRMPADAYLRGYRVEKGSVLGDTQDG